MSNFTETLYYLKCRISKVGMDDELDILEDYIDELEQAVGKVRLKVIVEKMEQKYG